MATIAPTAAGGTIATQAAAAGDKYVNSGSERLYIVNASGGSITVTFDSQQACNQGFDHDTTLTVPAGATRLAPALPIARYNDPSGFVNVAYTATPSITVGVLQA